MIFLFTVIRWLHEFSLMALFGGALLRGLLHGRLPALELPRGKLRLALAVLALATACLWLGFAAAQMAGDPKAMFDPHVLMLTATQTLFGQLFLARFVLLVLLCAALARTSRESLVALPSGLALLLISVTGHAAEASPAHFTAIGTVSDGLHLLTGGFWIGGLAVLAMLFTRKTEVGLLAAATAIFAEWGMIAVAGLILTGMLNAATILLGGEAHDAPLYLAVLGAKLILVTAMVALALDNHFRLLPRLERSGPDRLLKNIRREFGLGLVVVALASLLTLLAPTQ